jgi:hexosaminidase
MPGHCQAALAAYPELSCTGGPFDVQTMWGIHPDIYCAGSDDVFAFLESVLEYVLGLFPSPYIHVGGDEAPKERWRACPRCQARIAAEGLADEDALQAWFIRRIERWLSERGRRLVGWDEILEGDFADVAPGATVQAWRGTRGAVAAVRAGLDAVVSPTSHAYFDYDVGILDLQQVHAFDPVPDVLTGDEPGRVLGGAANLWTERFPPERVDAMLFPRLLAMAEALWTAPADRDFPAFVERVAALRPALDALGVQAGPAARPVVLAVDGGGAADLRLKARLDERVAEAFAGRSTVLRRRVADAAGYRPDLPVDRQDAPAVTTADAACDGPFVVTLTPEAQLVLVQAFFDERPYGAPAVAEVRGHLALGRPAVFADAPSSRYPGGGAAGLTDGRFGSRDFKDGVWSGFEGMDAEAAIDLGAATPLRRLSLRALQNAHEWVFLPRRVRFYVSDDGAVWREAGAAAHDVSDRWQDPLIHEFACDVAVTARWIRAVAETFGPCPDWHPGVGQPTWIFLDEFTAD